MKKIKVYQYRVIVLTIVVLAIIVGINFYKRFKPIKFNLDNVNEVNICSTNAYESVKNNITITNKNEIKELLGDLDNKTFSHKKMPKSYTMMEDFMITAGEYMIILPNSIHNEKDIGKIRYNNDYATIESASELIRKVEEIWNKYHPEFGI